MTYQVRGTIPCVICGAENSIGRKLCRPCYQRMWKAKRLNEFKVLAPEDVFLNRVEKTETCWLWKGTKNGYGYGIFLMQGERPVRAHRYSYEFFKGKIPTGKIIMHTCDNPPCVNPDHLRVGTKEENNKDTAIKRRHNYGINHWNGKLSDDDVKNIRESSDKQAVLAKRYGVSQSHISHIKRGRHRR